MKKITFKVLLASAMLFVGNCIYADEALKLHYTFGNYNDATIYDETANDYDGTLQNNAAIKQMDSYTVLDLGKENGYLDMGAKTGELINTLTDFSVSTYVYIDESTDLSPNGNFIFSFANSTDIATDQNGNMFLSARSQRYAISKTHWVGESGLEVGTQLGKGAWKHVTYTQEGTSGKLYVNGVIVKSGTISITPSELGQTAYNFIGRAPYAGDAYLSNTLVYDFRVYNKALTTDEVQAFTAILNNLDQAYEKQLLIDVREALIINDGKEETIQDIKLPNSLVGGILISWQSSNEQCINNEGKVTRPAVGSSFETVTLTATLSKNGLTETKNFTIKVMPLLNDAASIQSDLNNVEVQWLQNCIREKITLPATGTEGSVITWQSGSPDYINNEGKVLKLSPHGNGTLSVTLTATFTKGTETVNHDFNVCIEEEENYTAYLFAYFTGNSLAEEAIRFAISRDGLNYRSLNNNTAIINSAGISDKGGVRDPHILRGVNDNAYYMVVTDMKSGDGWNSNHGMVLLKSTDLINWTSSKIDIKATYPQFSDATRVWAPQTIYDHEQNKYMIYFSIGTLNTSDVIHYAYVNNDFTAFESAPQPLMQHPQGKACIDGDIIYENGKYHLFFKTEGDGNGIKKAVSDKLTEGYVIQDDYLQQTTEDVEGACVFRLTNTDTYILMYDVYNNGRYEFTRSNTLETFSLIDGRSVSMDFHPRHGTTIPITEEEAERLMAQWGKAKEADIISTASPAVKSKNWLKNTSAGTIFLPAKDGTDLSVFNPEFVTLPGVSITPETPQDFTNGAVSYTVSFNGTDKTYQVTAAVYNNPVLDGYYADPEILYSEKTDKFYLYPTSDGYVGWGGYQLKAFSSPDLVNWTDEGVIIDMHTSDVTWANGNAWAPCIIEKKIDNQYKYYYYFSGGQDGGEKKIGVAVADDPTGPFTDSGKPLISSLPSGVSGGQQIDPDVFTDPKTGKSYLYWGNGYLAVAELNDDMVSINESTTKVITPNDGTFREGIYVFYRDNKYYFFWSQDDTGSENYKVRYGISSSPTGPISIPAGNTVIQKRTAQGIYATGHCSVLQLPGRDEWYIVYHRFGLQRTDPSGYRREVCIDKLEFNSDGSVKQVTPTLLGIEKVSTTPSSVETVTTDKKTFIVYPNPAVNEINITNKKNCKLSIYDTFGRKVLERKIKSENEIIDISTLPVGSYIVTATDEAGEFCYNILMKN